MGFTVYGAEQNCDCNWWTGKDMEMLYFKVMCHHLSEETMESHNNPQSTVMFGGEIWKWRLLTNTTGVESLLRS
jgi:hypothetical protein